MNKNPKVIVAGFRRVRSIKRLLKSISLAKFPSSGVSITISLDGGYSKEVLQVSLDFKNQFKSGTVEVIARDQNIGLRNHIIWCGEQAQIYGSVIVLEDDLFVDPQFYFYALAALEHYADHDKIAGIALYSQRYNEYVKQPFIPLENGYSTYLMQVACSWGQLWTAKQWHDFYEWYEKNQESSLENLKELPEVVSKWSPRSWKKYYSAYLAVNDKYLAYPFRSYTTNCSDPGGEHLTEGSTLFQVPLAFSERPDDTFAFGDIDSEVVLYDAYMEPSATIITKLFELDIDANELCIDFYASKPKGLMQRYQFAISSKPSKSPLKSYKLGFKPFEMMQCFGAFDSGDVHLSKIEDIYYRKYFNYYNLTTYLSGFSAVNKQFIPQLFMQTIKRLLSYRGFKR